MVCPPVYTSNSASLLEARLCLTQGVLAGSQQNGVSAVFLGTLTVQAGSIPGQTTDFRSVLMLAYLSRYGIQWV